MKYTVFFILFCIYLLNVAVIPCNAQSNMKKRAITDTIYLSDVAGKKYAATIHKLEKRTWNSGATPAETQPGDIFVKGYTILSKIRTKDSLVYFCALPLKAGQGHMPRFVPRTITSFAVSGRLKGVQKELFYEGTEWAPQAVWLHSPKELWLKVKYSPQGHKKGQPKEDHYLKIVFPFDAS